MPRMFGKDIKKTLTCKLVFIIIYYWCLVKKNEIFVFILHPTPFLGKNELQCLFHLHH